MSLPPEVGLGLQIGGNLFKGIAGVKAGNEARARLHGQAREEERAGNEEIIRRRDRARKAIGEQITASFSGGFHGNQGTALDALTESQVNAVLEAQDVRREVAGRARSLREEGDIRRREGRFALVEGLLGAGSAFAGHKSDWADARSGRRE